MTAYRPALPSLETPGPRVLVIDDGAEARDLYRACFELEGFAADAAEDGPSGIARAHDFPPDVVILDFSMPQMDGVEVLRRLKADPETRGIPVVMITAAAELVPLEARARCAAFLEKPCDPYHLLRVLGGITGWNGPSPARGHATSHD